MPEKPSKEERQRLQAAEADRLGKIALGVLCDHVGRSRAITMGDFYVAVFGQPWKSRINGTRKLRHLVTALREEGRAICSDGTGYYLASAGSEMDDYCDHLKRAGLEKLKLAAAIRKMSFPAYMAEVQLNLGLEVPCDGR